VVARAVDGEAAAAAPPPNHRNGNGQPVALQDGKLTQERLEAHLWSAADILRGSIDSSD